MVINPESCRAVPCGAFCTNLCCNSEYALFYKSEHHPLAFIWATSAFLDGICEHIKQNWKHITHSCACFLVGGNLAISISKCCIRLSSQVLCRRRLSGKMKQKMEAIRAILSVEICACVFFFLFFFWTILFMLQIHCKILMICCARRFLCCY